jgi:REP element-mobilizing transposase RayT
MTRKSYSEINPHLTWHTKHNAPVLTGAIENRLHQYLQHRILKTPGVLFHAIGGIEDHVHVAVSVPPSLLVSDWIGELKGASAYYINHQIAKRKLLAWQEGYGVVCFGTKALPWVVRYVLNQREHHARGAVYARLERIDGEG